MEANYEALKYVVQAKNLLFKPWDEEVAKEMEELLNKAEEAIIGKKGG